MNNEQISNNKSSAAVAAIPIIIIFLPLVYSLFSFVFAQDSQDTQPFYEKPSAIYTKCIQGYDKEYMRHHHWELLRSVRENVVRHGIRGEVSIKKCRDCHTSRERFCTKCHEATSMSPDCWGCHYYP
ncbi:hypothetical protein ACFL5P_01940 [candidate division KSB1 bacterium]